MATQALEVLCLLDAHCLPGMNPRVKRALILECTGMTNVHIAAHERVKPGTIDHLLRIAAAEIELCLPVDVRAGKALRGYWVGKHGGECLAGELAALRGRTA